MRKILVLLLILLTSIINAHSQNNILINHSEIDKTIEFLKDSFNIPGIAAGIAMNDKVLYKKALGFSNLETRTPLKLNSMWHICSISKQFAAVAMMKLAEENRVQLSDKIHLYIDSLNDNYDGITVHDLLSQTSGIKDYLNEKNLYGHSWKEVRKNIFSDTLNFTPGSQWRYSNTGFWTIAKIIEDISGINYERYLQKNFFSVLEMKNTRRITASEIINQRVNGYVYRNGNFYNSTVDINQFSGQGDGDMMTTLEDLLKWNLALVKGKIIPRNLVDKLWTPTLLNNGEIAEVFPNSRIYYGLGWFIKYLNETKIVWTPGSGFGFSTSSQYIPQYNLTIIVFCNKQQFLMADQIGFRIAQKLISQPKNLALPE